MSNTAKPGDTVAVHYTGKLADGSIFDTSQGRDPLEFTLGERRVIPGFDEAVSGMRPGEKKTAEITADDAYGPHMPELIVEFPRDQIPPGVAGQVGEEVQVQTTAGDAIRALVVDVSEGAVTIDANHPLAGKDLTFDIELVDVRKEA